MFVKKEGYAKNLLVIYVFEEIFEKIRFKNKKINSITLSKDFNVFVETPLEPFMARRVVLVYAVICNVLTMEVKFVVGDAQIQFTRQAVLVSNLV